MEVLVHRPDLVFADVPRVITLPPRMRLVLRERELLLAVASRGWVLGLPGTVLSRWPLESVRVVVERRWSAYLGVHVSGEGATVDLAASWRHCGRVELIARRLG